MPKPHERKRIYQGATIPLFRFRHKGTTKVPKERSQLLVARPVILDAELKRDHRHAIAINHLGISHCAQHAKELRIGFYFAVVESEF